MRLLRQHPGISFGIHLMILFAWSGVSGGVAAGLSLSGLRKVVVTLSGHE